MRYCVGCDESAAAHSCVLLAGELFVLKRMLLLCRSFDAVM